MRGVLVNRAINRDALRARGESGRHRTGRSRLRANGRRHGFCLARTRVE